MAIMRFRMFSLALFTLYIHSLLFGLRKRLWTK